MLDPKYTMAIYSAHDYTIYGVLSNLRLYSEYECMLGFGSTLTFELWQGTPPSHQSGPAKIPLSSDQAQAVTSSEHKVVRILLNPSPFLDTNSKVSNLVQDSHEIVLAELLEVEARHLSSAMRSMYEALAANAPSVAPEDGHENDD